MTVHLCDRCGNVMRLEARVQWEPYGTEPVEFRPMEPVLVGASLCENCLMMFKAWFGGPKAFSDSWFRKSDV